MKARSLGASQHHTNRGWSVAIANRVAAAIYGCIAGRLPINLISSALWGAVAARGIDQWSLN